MAIDHPTLPAQVDPADIFGWIEASQFSRRIR